MAIEAKPVGRPRKYFLGKPILNSYQGHIVTEAYKYDPTLVLEFLSKCRRTCRKDRVVLDKWERHFAYNKAPFITILDGKEVRLFKLRVV